MNLSEDAKILFDTPLNELSFIVLDTETTGTNPEDGDRIIEIAAVKIESGFRINKRETFQSLVNPEISIPKSSTLIHGITDAHVENAPDICSVMYDFLEFSRGAVPVAHRARKDMAFLRSEMKDYGIANPFELFIDTLKLSRRLYPHADKHNLDAITDRFNIENNSGFQRHRALYDAMNTAVAFKIMIKKIFEERCYILGELVQYLK